jgi:hypothetical protein
MLLKDGVDATIGGIAAACRSSDAAKQFQWLRRRSGVDVSPHLNRGVVATMELRVCYQATKKLTLPPARAAVLPAQAAGFRPGCGTRESREALRVPGAGCV